MVDLSKVPQAVAIQPIQCANPKCEMLHLALMDGNAKPIACLAVDPFDFLVMIKSWEGQILTNRLNKLMRVGALVQEHEGLAN